MPPGREHQSGQREFAAAMHQMGRIARALRDNEDTRSSQLHLASHRELLRSCIGKVAAWINEVGRLGCAK